jgi:D-3-phosphoglycerate dehydrogenase / 2-oxoglutarate reductase
MKTPYFIVDFDSTFTRVEALDLLAEIVLAHSGRKAEVLQQIQDITNRGMDGELDFRQSLSQRLALLHAHRDHIQHLAERLKEEISPSFLRNQAHFAALRENVYVVSNGFSDFIVPVVEHYGLLAQNVFANEFVYDEKGYVTGFDESSPLSQSGGKSRVIRDLKLKGDVYVIGDGANDLEIRKAGYANKFYLFTENVEREKVKPEADHVAPNVDEILYELKMSRSLSYPKNRIRVLLLEDVPPSAAQRFEAEGFKVERVEGPLSEDELCRKIRKVNVLGAGPATVVSEKVIASARRLISVGAYSIDGRHIDLDACSKHGVAVFNAPFSNTRSVVELTLANIIMLMRRVPDKARAMHQGQWAQNGHPGYEVRGKKLGIVGYGNIGAQLSVLAEALGLEVYFYDLTDKLPLGNARKCGSLDELLTVSDIVSVHVDKQTFNDHLFGPAQFARMKPGAIFLNLSAPGTVETSALRQAIQAGQVAGCAVDVFPDEPWRDGQAFQSELIGLPNTILTPHIGGHTAEAQQDIGQFVTSKIIQYINTGNSVGSLNFPPVQAPPTSNAHRLLHIHHNVPNVLAQIGQILASHHINILGQYLKTNEHIGYVITDVDKEYSAELLEQLKQIEPTIWFRVLY